MSSVGLELHLERNGQWLLQRHRDVRHPFYAVLNAGSTVFGVFKPGLAHSWYYCKRYIRSELLLHHVMAVYYLFPVFPVHSLFPVFSLREGINNM